MIEGTVTSTSSCDRCKGEFPSIAMAYWLIEVSPRPVVSDRAGVAVGAPKYCKICAEEVKKSLQVVFGDQIRLFS